MKHITFAILFLLAISVCFGQSRGLRILSSAAIPGLGQLSSGSSYGYAMLSAEIGIIASLMYLNNEEKLTRSAYKDYAMKHAHVLPGDYSADYYSHLSRYDSSGFEAGGYNAMIRQLAIQAFPNDPNAQQAYIDANIYPADQAWYWDALENRREYSQLRIHGKNLRDYSKMATGVLFLNHLISVIDVLRYPLNKDSRLSFSYDGDKTLIILDYSF